MYRTESVGDSGSQLSPDFRRQMSNGGTNSLGIHRDFPFFVPAAKRTARPPVPVQTSIRLSGFPDYAFQLGSVIFVGVEAQ